MSDADTLKEIRRGMAGFTRVTHKDRAFLLAEIDRLQAIVDKHKTADGVAVGHGDKVWYPGDPEYGTVTCHVCNEGGFDAIKSCYSTPEKAESAAGGKEQK